MCAHMRTGGGGLQGRGVHTCVQVCVLRGASGQRAKSRVGSSWKTRLPNTRHTEGSCTYPGHLVTPVGAPGSRETAENSSPGPAQALQHAGASGLTVASPVTASSTLTTPQAWFQLCRLLPSGHFTPNTPPHDAGLLREALARTAGTICRQAWAQSAGSRLPGRAGAPGQGGLGATAWLAFPILSARQAATRMSM